MVSHSVRENDQMLGIKAQQFVGFLGQYLMSRRASSLEGICLRFVDDYRS